jgi:hypothetical protein
VINTALIPNLSITKPKTGEKNADIKYGTLYKVPAVVGSNPY